MRQLNQREARLVGELPVGRALRAWMSEVLDYLATKQGMADTLQVLCRMTKG